MAFNTNIIHVLLEDEVQNNGNGGEIKGENQKKSVVNQWPHHEGDRKPKQAYKYKSNFVKVRDQKNIIPTPQQKYIVVSSREFLNFCSNVALENIKKLKIDEFKEEEILWKALPCPRTVLAEKK